MSLAMSSQPDDMLDLNAAVSAVVETDLAPLVAEIDQQGAYPKTVLQSLGIAGAFRQHLPSQNAGKLDMVSAIQAMDRVSQECLSSGFMTWCQDVLGWYIENGASEFLKSELLPDVAGGVALGGTGLSNPMKYFSGIERLQLKGEETAGGYLVNGTLPWVSNLGPDHYFAAVFHVDQPEPREVMAIIPCSDENLSMRPPREFIAMEGTGTFSCRFKNLFVPKQQVLADPIGPYLKKIKAGFILMQAGMATGLVRGCIELMRDVDKQLGHVNKYLDNSPNQIEDQLNQLGERALKLAQTPYETDIEYIKEVIRVRLAGSELSLKAAQSAMLHQGARGYFATAAPQRRVRESIFVAIVTPAIKHLRKELESLEQKS